MSEVKNIKQLDSFLDGSEWPACQVQKGMETNLFFAKAGEKFTLSPETLALEYDYIRELVWQDVMDLLASAGVVSLEGDNVFLKLVRGFGCKTRKIVRTISDECASEPVVCGWKAVRNCRCSGDHELVLNLVDVVNEQLRARLMQFDLSNDADLLVLLKKSLRQATRSLERYDSYKLVTDDGFIAKVVELFAKYKPFKNGAMMDFDTQLRVFVASYLKQPEYSSVVNTVYCAISAPLFEHPSRKRNGRSF